MFRMIMTAIGLLALASGSGPALAQGKGHGPGGPPGHAKNKGKKVPPGQAKKRGHGAGPANRGPGRIVRDYYGGSYWPCYRGLPPGIRKNLRRGKPVPPGLAKRCRLPSRLARRLPYYKPGYTYYGIGDVLYQVRPAGNVIISVYVDLF